MPPFAVRGRCWSRDRPGPSGEEPPSVRRRRLFTLITIAACVAPRAAADALELAARARTRGARGRRRGLLLRELRPAGARLAQAVSRASSSPTRPAASPRSVRPRRAASSCRSGSTTSSRSARCAGSAGSASASRRSRSRSSRSGWSTRSRCCRCRSRPPPRARTSFRGPLLIVVAFGVGCFALLVASAWLVRAAAPAPQRPPAPRVGARLRAQDTRAAAATRSSPGFYLLVCWTTRAIGSALLLSALGFAFSPTIALCVLCLSAAAGVDPDHRGRRRRERRRHRRRSCSRSASARTSPSTSRSPPGCS